MDQAEGNKVTLVNNAAISLRSRLDELRSKSSNRLQLKNPDPTLNKTMLLKDTFLSVFPNYGVS
jgi:hypothetical protein